MRIALVCLDRGVPLGGAKGSSVHLRAVARALLRAGHQVHAFVYETGESERFQGLLDAGLRVQSLPNPVRMTTLSGLLERAGVELVLERLSLLAPQGASAAALLGIPHVYEVNAPLDREAAAYRGLTDSIEARQTFEAGFGWSSGAVAVSDEVAAWVREMAPPRYRTIVIPNGADDAFLNPAKPETVERARRKLGWTPDRFHVGFVGSFRPWHDLETVTGAMAQLGERVPSEMVLVGDGPSLAGTLSMAVTYGVHHVHVAHVSHEDVPAYLHLCDCVVVPYADANAYFSPLKLIEAMCAGKPVVASATGPCARLVRDGHDGLLVEPGNETALAAAFERLALDPELRARLGTAARQRIAGQHTWTHVVERTLEFARKLEPVVGI